MVLSMVVLNRGDNKVLGKIGHSLAFAGCRDGPQASM